MWREKTISWVAAETAHEKPLALRVGKPENLGARTRTNYKLDPHMMVGPWIEPGTHFWEASALVTAPFLIPQREHQKRERTPVKGIRLW